MWRLTKQKDSNKKKNNQPEIFVCNAMMTNLLERFLRPSEGNCRAQCQLTQMIPQNSLLPKVTNGRTQANQKASKKSPNYRRGNNRTYSNINTQSHRPELLANSPWCRLSDRLDRDWSRFRVAYASNPMDLRLSSKPAKRASLPVIDIN